MAASSSSAAASTATPSLRRSASSSETLGLRISSTATAAAAPAPTPIESCFIRVSRLRLIDTGEELSQWQQRARRQWGAGSALTVRMSTATHTIGSTPPQRVHFFTSDQQLLEGSPAMPMGTGANGTSSMIAPPSPLGPNRAGGSSPFSILTNQGGGAGANNNGSSSPLGGAGAPGGSPNSFSSRCGLGGISWEAMDWRFAVSSAQASSTVKQGIAGVAPVSSPKTASAGAAAAAPSKPATMVVLEVVSHEKATGTVIGIGTVDVAPFCESGAAHAHQTVHVYPAGAMTAATVHCVIDVDLFSSSGSGAEAAASAGSPFGVGGGGGGSSALRRGRRPASTLQQLHRQMAAPAPFLLGPLRVSNENVFFPSFLIGADSTYIISNVLHVDNHTDRFYKVTLCKTGAPRHIADGIRTHPGDSFVIGPRQQHFLSLTWSSPTMPALQSATLSLQIEAGEVPHLAAPLAGAGGNQSDDEGGEAPGDPAKGGSALSSSSNLSFAARHGDAAIGPPSMPLNIFFAAPQAHQQRPDTPYQYWVNTVCIASNPEYVDNALPYIRSVLPVFLLQRDADDEIFITDKDSGEVSRVGPMGSILGSSAGATSSFSSPHLKLGSSASGGTGGAHNASVSSNGSAPSYTGSSGSGGSGGNPPARSPTTVASSAGAAGYMVVTPRFGGPSRPLAPKGIDVHNAACCCVLSMGTLRGLPISNRAASRAPRFKVVVLSAGKGWSTVSRETSAVLPQSSGAVRWSAGGGGGGNGGAGGGQIGGGADDANTFSASVSSLGPGDVTVGSITLRKEKAADTSQILQLGLVEVSPVDNDDQTPIGTALITLPPLTALLVPMVKLAVAFHVYDSFSGYDTLSHNSLLMTGTTMQFLLD